MGPVGDRFFMVNHAPFSPRSPRKATCPMSPTQSCRQPLNRSGYNAGQGQRSPCQARARALCERAPPSCRRSQSMCPEPGSPSLPIRRRNTQNCSLKAARHENNDAQKTLKDIELAVKAVHSALACNRAKVAARCLSPSPPGEGSPTSMPRTVGTPAARSLAAARSAAKQKQHTPELRSPRSTTSGDDPLGSSRRSLADARDQHKIEKQAVERSVSYCGGLLAKLDDMQKIAVACSGAKCTSN